jgi:gamma-polyglutamate biosynthesis protein CapA
MKFPTILVCVCLALIAESVSADAGSGISFCAAGDVLLDRGCRTMIRRQGYDYLFEGVGDYIRSRDLAFCNLECPLTPRGKRNGNAIAFRADSSYIEVLKRSGFDVFSLANNHILDYGSSALIDTRNILKANGLLPVGAGSNRAEADEPVFLTIRGTRLAFLAYVCVPGFGVVAPDKRPSPALADSASIREGIRAARKQADILIVSFHWGVEYTDRPTETQVGFAHLAVDEGADLVVGHHPHVIQSIEKYHGKFILYSLGNFVFDQHKPVQREALIFSCEFRGGGIVSPQIVPVLLPLRTFRPLFPECTDTIRISDRVREISKGFGVAFRDGDTATFLE